MKLKFAIAALSATISMAASAAPFALPEGPTYIKFDNREQIAISPGATTFAGTNEINWGVVLLSTINPGNVTNQNVIESTGASYFTNISSHNAQITGMFYGIEGLPSGTGGNAFPATLGYLDLYWRDLSLFSTSDISTVLPGARTSQSTATGYTDGDLLVRLKFSSGIISTDSSVFIAGSVIPTPGTGFVGIATSYAEVDTSVVGAWTDSLDSDWFTTAFGTRDFRFRNIYEELLPWNDLQNGILGARSTDPATAYAIPEPATLALVGLSLIGIGVARRRNTAKL